MKYLVHIPLPDGIEKARDFYCGLLRQHIIGETNRPMHCTVFVGRFDPRKEDKMIDELRKVELPRFKTQLTTLDVFGGGEKKTELVVKLARPEALSALHFAVADRLHGLLDRRAMPRFESSPEFGEETDERRSTCETYGSPFFGRFYQPHVSLAGVMPDVLQKNSLVQAYKMPGYEWIVRDFMLSCKGQEGWKLLKTFPLKNETPISG